MSGELHYRNDLYRGTAAYYDRFRPPYPPVLLDDLRARVPVSGTGRLLDLACGTGQIAFSLAAEFAEVVAVDQEAESVEFARLKARRLGVDNIRWVTATAGLQYEGRFEFVVTQRWTAESLIGLVYSTSFLNRTVLGHHVDAFESDLRMRLLACSPAGVYEDSTTFAYDLARRAA